MAAQIFTVTLEDLGTQTLNAYAPFQGVTIQAKSSGSGGNNISIIIDNSALVLAETAYSVQHDSTAGTTEFTGDEWNFGAAILNTDGTIPDSAPRISFGADPQVYRQYKFYRTGQYVYGFSPTLVRDVTHGTIVNAVSGSRTLRVANSGTVVDTMTAIVTLYDALVAIRDHSTLVEVVGAIINDKTPGGQAMLDLSVWTSSYVTGIVPSGSDPVLHADLIVYPNSSAPTETLTLTVTDATLTGAEVWSVRGDVSGLLANAITNVLYADGDYTFTIPPPSAESEIAPGTINVEYLPSDNTRSTTSTLCVVQPIIGSAGRAGTWEFVWTARPTSDCDCSNDPMLGGPTEECLGVSPGGPTVGLNDAHRYRQIRLDRYYRNLTASLFTDKVTTTPSSYISPDASLSGMAVATTSRNTIRTALDAIFTALTASPPTPWAASILHAVGDIVVPTTLNGLMFRAKRDGTTNTTEPTWATALGATTSDGSVTWEAFSQDAIAAYDDAFDKSEIGDLALDDAAFQ